MDTSIPFLPSPPESPPLGDSPLASFDGPPSAHSVLVLEPDDVRNTTLRLSQSGQPMYAVRSDNRGDRTDVRLATTADVQHDPSTPILATIHRKAFTPTVTLNRNRLSVNRWLKSGLGSNS